MTVPQLVDILKGYVDMGVMMQKPSAGGERELRRHYKVYASTVNYCSNASMRTKSQVLVKWAFDVCLKIKKQ